MVLHVTAGRPSYRVIALSQPPRLLQAARCNHPATTPQSDRNQPAISPQSACNQRAISDQAMRAITTYSLRHDDSLRHEYSLRRSRVNWYGICRKHSQLLNRRVFEAKTTPQL
jgi:hypothetical protein